MADFPRFLVALLWWTLWGPTALCERFLTALQRLVPSVESDTVAGMERQLDRHLATLPPAEQRRLTYVIAREVWAGTPEGAEAWDEAIALQILGAAQLNAAAEVPAVSLQAMLESDDICWRAVAHAAVAASRASVPELRHASKRAFGFLRSFADNSKRLALAELIGPEHANAMEVRRMLGCSVPEVAVEIRHMLSADVATLALHGRHVDIEGAGR